MQTFPAQQPAGQLAALHLAPLVGDTEPSVPTAPSCFAGPERPQAVAQASKATVAKRKRNQLPRFIRTPPGGAKDDIAIERIMTEWRGRV